VFFLVVARDEKHVKYKAEELEKLGVQYLIVCGKRLNYPNVIYREPRGKYDAINFGFNFVPQNADIVVLNDVDTKIKSLDSALQCFNLTGIALVFAKVHVKRGPQNFFYGLLDRIRQRLLITASGELMLVRRDVLERILPLKPCKAEDSLILFKVLEMGRNVIFCEDCYTETERTDSFREEQDYKRRTVCGIYQALSYTRPPVFIRLFYVLLPFVSPMLLVLGKKGCYWTKGILLGLSDYLVGDRAGVWG